MQQMYQEWPFFQSTIDLIEMILSKCDMRIASMYDALLAETEEEKALGVVLRGKFEETVKAVLEVRHLSAVMRPGSGLGGIDTSRLKAVSAALQLHCTAWVKLIVFSRQHFAISGWPEHLDFVRCSWAVLAQCIH